MKNVTTKSRATHYAVIASTVFGLSYGHAAAADTVTLKLSHWVPATHIIHEAMETWGSAVEDASGGKIKVEIFPAQQLGPAKDHYEMASFQLADATWIAPGYTPGRFPVISAGELPFLVTNGERASVAVDEWYRPHAQTEMSEVHYCLTMMQDPGVLHSRDKFTSADDLNGLKLRVATGTLGKYFGGLGASPVSIPAPDVRHAAETGLIDALTYGWKTAQALGVTDVFNNHLDLPVYSVPTQIIISKSFYDNLADELKPAIDNACSSKMAGALGKIWGEWEASGQSAISSDTGRAIYKPTAVLVSEMRASAEENEQAWIAAATKAGINGVAELESLRAKLDANNALLK